MADDRPIETPEEAIARLSRELEDFKTTIAARLPRRPTGDVEPTLRATAKPDTLLLQGQTVSRTTYAALWAWVVENGLSPSVFGAGDGSTTFTLPDLRGRMLIGAGALAPDTYTVGQSGGASLRTLATGNLPGHTHSMGGNTDSTSHNHSGSADSNSHGHTGSANNAGGHGGHCSGTSNVVPPGSGITLPSNYSGSGGDHGHSININSASHGHTVTVGSSSHSHPINGTTGSTGGGTGVDIRQPYYVGNWMIWT